MSATARRRALPAAALGVAALALAVHWAPRGGQDELVQVGAHVLPRGAHLEGDRLPPAHPLHAVLPPQPTDVEPAGYQDGPGAVLRVRRHCAWGLPGRNPYRGSVAQALQTAQVPAEVVQRISADVLAGRRVDRVAITNDAVTARASGRRFDARRIAMTYGMTLCLDTRTNFRGAHREQGDLYEAMDDQGRIYAVMVPDVCGNVSVLGQRADELLFDPPGAGVPRATPVGGQPQWSGRQAEWSPGDPRPWMRVPPDKRPRELPPLLRYTDPDRPRGSSDGGDVRNVPEPGTLALVGAALALVAWSRRGR